MVGLHGVAGQRVGGFSLRMDQRLGVPLALLGNPKTVVLTSRSTAWTRGRPDRREAPTTRVDCFGA